MKENNLMGNKIVAIRNVLVGITFMLVLITVGISHMNTDIHIADAKTSEKDYIIYAEEFVTTIDVELPNFDDVYNYLNGKIYPNRTNDGYVMPTIIVDKVTDGIKTVQALSEVLLHSKAPYAYDSSILKEGYRICMSSLSDLENDMYFSTENGTMTLFIVDDNGDTIYSTNVEFHFIYD